MATDDPKKAGRQDPRIVRSRVRSRLGASATAQPSPRNSAERLKKLREELDRLTEALIAKPAPAPKRETFQEALKRIAAEDDDDLA